VRVDADKSARAPLDNFERHRSKANTLQAPRHIVQKTAPHAPHAMFGGMKFE
jgi:hypothetical protein